MSFLLCTIIMILYTVIPFQTNETDRGPQESEKGKENTGDVVHMLAARTIVIDNSVIKGYHAFKIRPPYITPVMQLFIDRECTDVKDEYACLVWLHN